jgi:hypothetical protein
MVRFTSAVIALAWTSFSAGATVTSDARQPPAGGAALITHCYKMANRLVPRLRGRSAWVVRHADHCVRSGGSF